MSLARQQIGDQPQPGRPFGGGHAVLCPLLPQRAWLQGSRLIVERGGEVRQCDLATAARIKIRTIPPFISLSFEILSAYPEPKSKPARLVLAGPDWYTLTAQQARQLAQIIGSRAQDKKAADKIVWYLHGVAARKDFRTQPIDWSFRTDPEGLRKRQGDRPPGGRQQEQQREQQRHRTAPDTGRQTQGERPGITDQADRFGRLHQR